MSATVHLQALTEAELEQTQGGVAPLVVGAIAGYAFVVGIAKGYADAQEK